MNVTAAEVKELRVKTGAGMMECKTALLENGGDMAKAEKALKDRGFAIAKKREERATNQGRIFGLFSDDAASLLEVRCETDFVSQNAQFIHLGEECIREVHAKRLSAPNERMNALLVDAIALIKENLVFNGVHTVTAGPSDLVAGYVHGIGKIASIVRLGLPASELRNDPRICTLASDLALHVTAFAPVFVRPEEISAEYRTAGEAEYREEARRSGKPEKLWEQIVAGKWKKHLRSVCLTHQPYLRDEDISVAQAVGSVEREVGASIEISEFVYLSIAPAVCL